MDDDTIVYLIGLGVIAVGAVIMLGGFAAIAIEKCYKEYKEREDYKKRYLRV